MALELCPVRSLTPLGKEEKPGFFSLRLTLPDSMSEQGRNAWSNWAPGQFALLRPESWGPELSWGRPFSISRLEGGAVEFFFQVAGRGSRRLAGLRPGEPVWVSGPLGVGFALEEHRPTLLLAGGMGIAPFVGYAQGRRGQAETRLLFGHRAPLGCYPYDAFPPGLTKEHFPDKGPEDLERFLRRAAELLADNAARGGLALACGPLPFLRAMRDLGAACGAALQISLETRMACGAGVCLGCVVKTVPGGRGGFSGAPAPVCACGPVFWADAVDLGE